VIRRESGMTLIEVLVVIAITAVMLTLGAYAARNFWFVSGLDSAREQVVSQLRRLQEKTVSENHPLVYGAWFKVDSTQWGSVRFDPKDLSTTSDDECTLDGSAQNFPAGVSVSAVSFQTVSPQTSKCATVAPSGSQIAFFFAGGSATSGSLTLQQTKTGSTKGLTVSGLTGRVEKQ
jgi:prepilin-type N-terminal cleavage/methylation domain-containing protein